MLRLPEGKDITLSRSQLTVLSPGGFTWRGQSETAERGVLMLWNDGHLSGYFGYQGRLFSVNYMGGWLDPVKNPLVIELFVAYDFSICLGELMPEQRHVRLFRNGRNQAVRIPVEFELPGDEAIMHRDGDRLVIQPVRKRGLVALLETMKPLEESFPEIDDPIPAPENAL